MKVPLSKRIKKRWRAWLRIVHRDAGYLIVGLTVIYAASGIALNHLEEWGDIETVEEVREVQLSLVGQTGDEIAEEVAQLLSVEGELISKEQLGPMVTLAFPDREVVIDIDTGLASETKRERRFVIGALMWLHRARGKKAWKYFSDVFAIFLILMAVSGMFMLKGKKGFWGRGMFLVGLGIAIPVAYIYLVGS